MSEMRRALEKIAGLSNITLDRRDGETLDVTAAKLFYDRWKEILDIARAALASREEAAGFKPALFGALEFLESTNEWLAQRREGRPETNTEAALADVCFHRLTALEAALMAAYPQDWPPDARPALSEAPGFREGVEAAAKSLSYAISTMEEGNTENLNVNARLNGMRRALNIVLALSPSSGWERDMDAAPKRVPLWLAVMGEERPYLTEGSRRDDGTFTGGPPPFAWRPYVVPALPEVGG